MAPDLAHQILDTPWQKQKYAMYWNIKKDKLNKSFVIQIFGHLQFEGESHFRPHEMACNKFCSFNLTLSSQFAMRLMV